LSRKEKTSLFIAASIVNVTAVHATTTLQTSQHKALGHLLRKFAGSVFAIMSRNEWCYSCRATIFLLLPPNPYAAVMPANHGVLLLD
jgi:hypothetical protein